MWCVRGHHPWPAVEARLNQNLIFSDSQANPKEDSLASNLDVKLLCCDKNPLHQLTAESTCGTHFHSTCLDVPTPRQLKNVSPFQRMKKKKQWSKLDEVAEKSPQQQLKVTRQWVQS
jgi:hypothetical protein